MTGGRAIRGRLPALLIASACILVARADQQEEHFRFERPVAIAAPGPHRLPIDVPLLSGGKPFSVATAADRAIAQDGLADLRFFGAGGATVPYILVHAPARQPAWTSGELLPVARREKTSGFEADFHSATTIDAIRVSGITPPFLKRLILEGSGDRERWTLLAAQGTLFDLPEEGLRQTELPFSPGAYRYLRVTWDDANSGRVEMPRSVEARTLAGGAPRPSLTLRMPVERRPSEPGRSRYRVRLPAARLPVVALELDAEGGHVFREAAVFESRLSGGEAAPAELGRASLKRVVRDGIAAGVLRLPIAQPSEATLDVLIEDGPNPALVVQSVTAVFAELPWIYIEPTAPLVARYGNPLVSAPSYDLEAVRDSVNIGAVPQAAWGEPRSVAIGGVSPVPSTPLPETGAPIDPSSFSYLRAIPNGGAGLIALDLDAAVLAHSRGPGVRFADVRIVDATGHQVPYLIERRDEPIEVPLAIQPAETTAPGLESTPGHNRSLYSIALPYGNLPGARLALETSARVFRRQVQLGVLRPPDRRNRDTWLDTVDLMPWSHTDPDTPAPSVMLTVRQMPATDLLLAIDEGDNSRLPIVASRLLLPSYRLRFYRPAGGGSLRVVYGRDDIAPPRYDIALLAPQVMGSVAAELKPGPESGPGTSAPPGLVSPRMFWALLVLAVVVLLALIVRMLPGR